MDKQNISGETGSDAFRADQGSRSDAASQRAFGDAGEGKWAGAEGTARQMVSTTEHVASGLVSGVAAIAADLVHGVGDVGNEAVLVAKDTANCAIAGVGSVAETAVQTLTGLLVNLVGGVRQIGSAAIRGSGAVQGRAAETRPAAPPAPDDLAKRPEEVAIH
ncbi:MAG: hypothetical protein H7Z39_03590 [Burkholderiaceae bacterium]|nr:hypothetical protein [Burkholderiaceae bacterium]